MEGTGRNANSRGQKKLRYVCVLYMLPTPHEKCNHLCKHVLVKTFLKSKPKNFIIEKLSDLLGLSSYFQKEQMVQRTNDSSYLRK